MGQQISAGGEIVKSTLFIENRAKSETFECSNLVESITYLTERTGSPGKLTFDLIPSEEVSFLEGDPVRFSVDGTLVFFGYVFTREQDRWGRLSITCYDRLRYLKAKQSYTFTGMTVGDIIRVIARDFELSVSTIEDTGYKIPLLISNNKSCLDAINQAAQKTLLSTGRVYTFFDDGAGLSLREAGKMKTDVTIGAKSLATDFTYTTDIDQETYNQIKLVRPNKDTGKMDTYVVGDPKSIPQWGLLQYYEKVDEELNSAQITERAKTMLAYYDRVLRTLSIEALGRVGLRAGQMVFINLPSLKDLPLSRYVLLESVEHSFSNDSHTMKIETRALNGTD